MGCPTLLRAGEKDASLRRLQPTHDTSTRHAARFPLVPFALLGLAASHHEENARVEPRLTASLQLRRPCNPPDRRLRGRGPFIADRIEHRVVLGAVIGGPSTPCFPPAALSAARAHAASPLTSSVAPAPSAPDLSAGLSRDSRQDPASLPSRQGRPLRRTQDAFVRREPVPAPSEEERRAGSRRRLQPVQPASTTTNPSIPGCLPARLAQLALNRWGGGPIRHVDCMDPGSAAARPPLTVLADRAEHLARTPAGSARARGRRAFARRRLPLARHDASLAGAWPRPDLPGHLSSRSRAGIGWRVRYHARALRRPKPNAWRHQLRHPGLRPPRTALAR